MIPATTPHLAPWHVNQSYGRQPCPPYCPAVKALGPHALCSALCTVHAGSIRTVRTAVCSPHSPNHRLVYSIYTSQSAPPCCASSTNPSRLCHRPPCWSAQRCPVETGTGSILPSCPLSELYTAFICLVSMPSEHTILCIRRTNPPTSPQFGRTNHCALQALRCIARYQSAEYRDPGHHHIYRSLVWR
jgi:hypothetical protein